MKPDADFRLYLVTDRPLSCGRDIAELAAQAVDGGVTAVQLREKDCSSRQFLELALALKKALTGTDVPLIINDRADIALACKADGLHIGQSDLPFRTARALLGPDAIIGLSVETPEEAAAVETLDADYIGASAVFPSGTKDVGHVWGLEGLARLRRASRHVIVGIGGINSANAAQVIEAGADGIAVVSAICSDKNPGQAAKLLRKTVDKALLSRGNSSRKQGNAHANI